MADSIGSGFPTTGINKGHIFFDVDEDALWVYVSGPARLVTSWKLLSGRFATDPSTVGWGTNQAGAQWFNTTSGTFKCWTGSAIASVGGSSGSGGVQRWPWHWKGTELSSAFGAGGFSIFVAPAAGTITKWATMVGGVSLPENTFMQFYDDVLNSFTLIDSFTLTAGTNNNKVERTLSLSVASGRVVGVLTSNSYNPTVHNVTLDGFVDFTPS